MNRSSMSTQQQDVLDHVEAEQSDAHLLQLVAAGDRSALRSLYLRHEPWLTARMSHRCADPGLVEEALQDTFVVVWQTARRFEGRGDVAAWIWGIGVRRLLQRMRPRKNLMERLRGQRSPDHVSAEEQLLAGIEHSDVGGALARLSPELQAVVQATVLDGLTTKEASVLLGVPQGTVKTRMMRARIEMREALT